MSYLLDTNIISLAVKDNWKIKAKLGAIKFQRRTTYMSCITYFEIRRGFLAVDAPKQREKSVLILIIS